MPQPPLNSGVELPPRTKVLDKMRRNGAPVSGCAVSAASLILCSAS